MDAVRAVGTLLDRGAERVELRENPPVGVWDDQPDRHEAIREPVGNPCAERVQPLPCSRRDRDGAGEAVGEATAPEGIERVHLVQDELARDLIRVDLGEDGLDRAHVLVQAGVRRGAVDNVQDEVGRVRLFERGGEPLDQLVGEPADETDRVGEEVAPPVLLEGSRRRVERLEEPVVDRDVRVRQRIQKRRLARVRVAGERDHGGGRRAPPFALGVAAALELAKPLLEDADPPAGEAAVGFELRLAGAATSGAHAPTRSLQVKPHAPHAREVVLELRKLDLELSLCSDGVLGEDVENELGPVEDTRVERVFEAALLARVELGVDDDALRARLGHGLLQLRELALPDVGAWVGRRPVLDDLAHRLHPGRAQELARFRELVAGVGALLQHGDQEPALGLGSWRGIGLSVRHSSRIMPAEAPEYPDAVPRTETVAQGLAETTLALVDIPSESRREGDAAAWIEQAVPHGLLTLEHREDFTLLFTTARRPDTPLVLLAGHLDTVPAQENLPGQIVDGFVHGLGASDMKGGLAVMVELARWLDEDRPELAFDVALLFFPREELPQEESALPGFFAACPQMLEADLAVMLEPTDTAIHAGCLGNLNAELVFRGESAHSARPWQGQNAIERAVAGLGRILPVPTRVVELSGLRFVEVVSATGIHGGIASNVIPDRATCLLNFRYAPDRTPEEAEDRVRELARTAQAEVTITGNSRPAPVVSDSPLACRLREAGNLAVEPKQAWTPVAEFAAAGLDAINFGPGATRFAHRQDERVAVDSLVKAFETLQRFLAVRSSP